MDQLGRRLTFGVSQRDLHVNVATPFGDLEGLATHFPHIVREDFERDWAIWNCPQDVLCEGLVVRNPSLAHKRRICSEPLDVRLGVHLEYSGLIGPVSEYLDA